MAYCGKQGWTRLRATIWSARAAWLLAAMALSGCGGSSGTAPTSTPTPNSAPQAPSPPDLSAPERDAAQKVYSGTPRTPADFLSDPPPPGVIGAVSTLHLKSSDITPTTAVNFELCSDDTAEALAWSELRTARLPIYADLVEQNVSPRLIEFVRVPRNDSNARLRQRVFRCSYLDRSSSDLAADNGFAGTANTRPLDAAALKDLAEYLWQFTPFNNADYVVLRSAAVAVAVDSSGATMATDIAHAIDMARLIRGSTSDDCDRIELLRWTHTLNTASGALRRQLETLSSFGAHRTNGVVASCTP